jgi:hypothetical protein
LFDGLGSQFPDNVDYLGHRGVVAARLGERDLATQISGQLASMESPYVNGNHVLWRAKIAAVLGENEQAVSLLQESFRLGVPMGGITLHYDFDLASLRDYPPFEELMRPKG